jgi:NAD-dependent DNA ligase
VIPHIVAVVTPASQPQMPLVPYVWNSTHVDILLENKATDETVKEKNIAYFFTNLDVEGLGPGNAKKIIAAGFDTVPKILAMSEADFLKVAGFKEKMAMKLTASMEAQVQKATLPELMHATNLFGRGFGVKKFQLILAAEPTLLTAQWPVTEKVNRVAAIEGMAKKTAEQFVTEIPFFLTFLKETHLENKLHAPLSIPTGDTGHPLYGKQIVLTGFRDKVLLEKLAAIGAEQGSAVRKNTFAVLVKDTTAETSKTAEAKAWSIPILTVDAFIAKYQL